MVIERSREHLLITASRLRSKTFLRTKQYAYVIYLPFDSFLLTNKLA
jgi:hypothetical protein